MFWHKTLLSTLKCFGCMHDVRSSVHLISAFIICPWETLFLQFVTWHGAHPVPIGADLSISVFICTFTLLFHLGLSPDLQSMEQIRRIMRPTDVPDQGLLCDLLWSDPDKDVLGWGENDRGVSFTFGSEVVAKFLHKHDLDLICRAHQVITSVITNRNFTVGGGRVLARGKIHLVQDMIY